MQHPRQLSQDVKHQSTRCAFLGCVAPVWFSDCPLDCEILTNVDSRYSGHSRKFYPYIFQVMNNIYIHFILISSSSESDQSPVYRDGRLGEINLRK